MNFVERVVKRFRQEAWSKLESDAFLFTKQITSIWSGMRSNRSSYFITMLRGTSGRRETLSKRNCHDHDCHDHLESVSSMLALSIRLNQVWSDWTPSDTHNCPPALLRKMYAWCPVASPLSPPRKVMGRFRSSLAKSRSEVLQRGKNGKGVEGLCWAFDSYDQWLITQC